MPGIGTVDLGQFSAAVLVPSVEQQFVHVVSLSTNVRLHSGAEGVSPSPSPVERIPRCGIVTVSGRR